MVIAKGGDELLVPLADACADRVRLAEIEGRAGNVSQLSGRNEPCIDRRELLGRDRHLVAEDVGTRRTAQVEIGMIGEVDDGGTVCLRAILEPQRIAPGDDIGHLEGDSAGEALIAVRTDVTKGKARFGPVGAIDDAPHRLVESDPSAMEAVVAVVLGQAIFAAVEDEGRAANAIGIAPDQRAEIGVLRDIIRERGQRQDDVGADAAAVRRFDRDDGPAIGDDLRA